MEVLDRSLVSWLAAQARALDEGGELAAELTPRLGDAGLFRYGVPSTIGGSGGGVVDAMHAISALAEHSLTAAFVAWGQRAFIEYLLHAGAEPRPSCSSCASSWLKSRAQPCSSNCRRAAVKATCAAAFARVETIGV